MSWNVLYPLIPIVLCSSVYALIEEPINERKALPLTLSTTSHNRISVKRGSIEKIFGDEAYFNIMIDRTTGNAFITLIRPILEPTTLTVVTSTGLIQDLSVTSSEKASEYLILKESEEELDELTALSSDYHRPTVDFLNRILEGKVPLGYGQRPIKNEDDLKLPHPLIAIPYEALEGPFEHILVYKIKNTGKDPIRMSANPIKAGKVSWVFLNLHELRSKEEATCIASYPKREE